MFAIQVLLESDAGVKALKLAKFEHDEPHYMVREIVEAMANEVVDSGIVLGVIEDGKRPDDAALPSSGLCSLNGSSLGLRGAGSAGAD